ncbi:MAG TPA: MFS transporter [Polyangiaceae bacterium]|nr:MFS transporter [Polyangiaceae bacterium]
MTAQSDRPLPPALWVPTTYMAMGFVLSSVTLSTNFAFKNLGLPNGTITMLASVLTLPYVFKFLWAPLLELYKTKKYWVVLMQFGIAVGIALAGFALQLPAWLAASFGALMLCAILGATMDIGTDGLYVTVLNAKQQAGFAGIQSMAWTAGPLIATGALVPLAGVLHNKFGYTWQIAWTYVFVAAGAFLAVLGGWHGKILPSGGKAANAPSSAAQAMAGFAEAFRTFGKKQMIGRMLALAFFYRFGIYLLEKVGNVFLVANRSEGGLGLSNEAAGLIVGGWGSAAFLAASVLGGITLAKIGLNRWTLLLFCALINVPNVTFFWLSSAMPTPESFWLITTIICIEKFGYGFGAVAHMYYMMRQIAPGPFKTAHYAFATGTMGLCNFLTGFFSGQIQEAVGYQTFFAIVLVCAIPGLLAAWFAPFVHNMKEDAPVQPEQATA